MTKPIRILDDLKNEIQEDVHSQRVDEVYLQLVRLFPLIEIKSKEQHRESKKVIEHVIRTLNREEVPSSVAKSLRDYMICLTKLIQDFEKKNYPAEKISAEEMLEFFIEQHGLKQADLAEDLGGQSVVSKVLSGERELNKAQIERLAKRFKVSIEVFF